MRPSPLRFRRPCAQPRKMLETIHGRDELVLTEVLPAARARAEYQRTHFKNMREVAAALKSA